MFRALSLCALLLMLVQPAFAQIELREQPYESKSAGLSLRPPADVKQRVNRGVGDEVVRFFPEDGSWALIVRRILPSAPRPLRDEPPATIGAPPRIGIVDEIAQTAPSDRQGELLRDESLPIAGFNAAIITTTYTRMETRRLFQQAIIQRSENWYYVISLDTPFHEQDIATDPAARDAVEMFEAVLDSVKVLDQRELKIDQDDRLIRTRSLMVNWTEQRLRDALVDEQWLRVIKGGKDIGYSYIVEEVASGVPDKPANRESDINADGFRIGIRSRRFASVETEEGPRPVQIDAELWNWSNFKREREAFTRLAVQTSQDKTSWLQEVGNSARVLRARPDPTAPDGVDARLVYALDVQSQTDAGSLDPFEQELPPFYLPQALGHLLPRIVPLTEPQTYLFATYVPGAHVVMLRYVDVLAESDVDFNGKSQRLITIVDRLGLEGAESHHYFTRGGKYVGTFEPEADQMIIPADPTTLETIWKDADLSRPAIKNGN